MVEMERTHKHHRSRRNNNNKSKKPPKVPIKTYRWEEVRRSRKKGGYPWTYLYKRPFTEIVDPEQFTMDAFRRAKSSSPTSRVDISEVSSWADYSGKTTPTLLQELINEPSSPSFETGKSTKSFKALSDAADDESAESSDNISQYLDKEERESIPRIITPKGSTKSAPEFPSSSKRKPSIESKLNQAKEGMVKKLQKAKKSMIKVPKLSFPTKKMRKPSSTPPKEEKLKNQSEKSKRAATNPVYIHIPLKPPPGETDEFSHLEFELKSTTNGNVNKNKAPEEEIPISSNTPSPSSSIRRKQPLKINPLYKQLLKDVCELGNKEQAEKEAQLQTPSLILDAETVVNKSEIKIPSSPSSPEEEKEEARIEEDFDKLFEASSSKLPIIIESENSRNIRSKSAEPQTNNKQRRSSLESSYSRKSLSKLAIIKKLKVATEKIKNAFSMDTLLRRKESSTKSVSKTEDEPSTSSSLSVKKPKSKDLPKPKKNIEPVYIHIPLKPPEGEKDEFSYLDEETLSDPTQQNPSRKEERTDSLESTSPTDNGDIQFIFLTPPSDDEILDKDETDLPETPSSDEMLPLSTLKKLAEDAVDQISPPAIKITTLETVREESISDKSSINNDVSLKSDLDRSENETVVVDVEDGLNETKTEEEVLKSALKTTAESSTAVKRVSFKRKSKTGDIKVDSGYEIIEIPKDEAAAAPEEAAASISSIKNEEKTVDSLPEDYNKWSNIAGDHEYEPINAPSSSPDEEVPMNVVAPRSSPITVVFREDDSDDPKIVISATDILEQPYYDDEENKQKRSFFQIGRFRKRSNSSISETQSKTSQNAEIPSPAPELEERRPSSTQKLQDAIKLQTGKLKAKFQNIHLPKAPEFKRPQLFNKFPKIPDRTVIHLPNISIPGAQKRTETHTIETIRQYSTESNVDDSELKNKRFFDFKKFSGTFPRFNKNKTKKPPSSSSSSQQRKSIETEVAFATMPRSGNNNAEVQELPEESFRFNAEKSTPNKEVLNYEREVQAINEAEYLKRWQHGNFRDGTTEEEQIVGALVQQRFGKSSGQGSEQSNSETLEARLQRDDEICRPAAGYFEAYDDDDEFNISSINNNNNNPMITDLDNLEDEEQTTGNGYSSEGSLNNLPHRGGGGGRLGKLDVNSDEFFVVQEISEGFQTPANALAQMNAYDPIGSNRSLPTQSVTVKPERKSIKNKPKRRRTPHVSQEKMIHDDEESIEELIIPDRPKRRSKRNKKKPSEIIVVSPDEEPLFSSEPHDDGHHQRLDFPRESLGILGDDEDEIEAPLIIAAPPRKQRSLKSLTQSEENNESILFELEEPPRPDRRSRSTSKISSTPPTSHTARDNSDGFFEHNNNAENAEAPIPCVEEPCIQDIRDYMGYAIVDKSKPAREPPLPPPRTPPRRKKRGISVESVEQQEKFATVPRNHHQESVPIRPLRNYSTLSHMKTGASSRKDSFYENHQNNNNNKENASTSAVQYTEIDRNKDELNRDNLISGDIVQKMRQRPLPAPPRPPRTKSSRHHRKSLQDITSEIQNIQQEEITVSTQTEPLPSDFVCEEIITQEPTDTVLTPSRGIMAVPPPSSSSSPLVERFELFDPRRRELLTPTQYSFEETVTHGTLLVKPLNGAEILPEHQLSREHLIPINREYETTEIPESFHRLKSPQEAPKVVQVDKLHVSDLDVDKLTVNKLVASKMIVSEIDTSSITTNEIITARRDGSNNCTTLKFDAVQKKTPTTTEEVELESPQNYSDINNDDPPPVPPPRDPSEEENNSSSSIRLQKMQEPDIDDDDDQQQNEPPPPPRPPQPLDSAFYLPSQPPASFYALRAKKMVNDDEEDIIPTPPSRRRRNHRSSRPNRSSSTTDDDSTLNRHPYNRNFPRFSSEPACSSNNIAELSGQLMNACGNRINNSLKRLIYYLTGNVLRNYDGNQDLHVFMIIILVLIAGLILLGYGEDERTVVHLHHWEFFNPPKDL